MAVDRACACVNCHKESSGSERANYGFMGPAAPFSRHVPDQLKAMHPKIRWRSIAGIGNVLRHEYHAISDKVIWKVIQDELPPLKAAVTTMKAAIKE